MYLDASVSISSATLSTLSPLFPPPIIETAHTYLRHFDTAATLSRPAALRKRIVDLTRSNRHAILQRLYSTAIEGLQGPYAWLALRPQGLSKTRRVLLPDFFWTSFLTSFLLGRRTAMAERVWDDMAKLGITPPISAWNALLDGYSKTSRIEDAIRTWDVMTAHGVKPDALSYRALISGLHKAKRHQEASFRLNEFKRESSCAEPPFDPSAILAVYNTAINQLLFASREEYALSVLRTLEAQGPRPDIVTYNTLLRYYGRKGNLREMAKILAKLGTDSVQADIYTFSTVLSAMLKVRPDADKLMINFMKKQGITPDTTILTSIISHQLREHDLKNALDLLSRMENKEYPGVEPNDITYTAVLSGLNSENWLDSRVADEESRRIWDRMQKRNLQPNPATYNILLQAALASPDPQGLSNALTYYQDMKSRRAYMGNDMWYLLLRGLVRRKEFGLAREVVDDLARHTGAEYGLPSALQELVRTVRAGV
ncbi:uncharacterized protein BXZ73DRAFT_39236 [Epithele typhae]|uniref:uncharacterized protein n=1 Tax=Epithele typhae TaxID=378194 RepID=UPI00200769AB|nr:uncharacterized protein BXZ73DRAFT_39236 [Epithele typhae]KAH9944129.1 hypothetical protein BXZ73DRAFT_39236 [Epithele typhae]